MDTSKTIANKKGNEKGEKTHLELPTAPCHVNTKKEKGPCLASRGSSLCYISNIVSQKMTKSEALHIFVKGLYHVLAVRQLIRTDVARLSVDQLRQPV